MPYKDVLLAVCPIKTRCFVPCRVRVPRAGGEAAACPRWPRLPGRGGAPGGGRRQRQQRLHPHPLLQPAAAAAARPGQGETTVHCVLRSVGGNTFCLQSVLRSSLWLAINRSIKLSPVFFVFSCFCRFHSVYVRLFQKLIKRQAMPITFVMKLYSEYISISFFV